jgi:nitrite reductase/ring-hydroxylating ferredoxin subunit
MSSPTELGSLVSDATVVCKVDDLPPGATRHVSLGRLAFGVFNVGGQFHALVNRCPHRGAPVCLGPVTGLAKPGPHPHEILLDRSGEILRCPRHGMEFDIASGDCVAGGRFKVRKAKVYVKDDFIMIEA